MKKQILSLAVMLVFLFLAVQPTLARTITVCPDGSCEYIHPQLGIINAVDNDMVYVSAGTYTGGINFSGKAIEVRSVSGAEQTILRGRGDYSGNDSVVTFNSGEGPDSVLDGFTLSGGTGTDYCLIGDWCPGFPIFAGGGVAIYNNSSPTVQNCLIVENHLAPSYGASEGAGMIIRGGSPLIYGCIVSNNSASQSGGLAGIGAAMIGEVTSMTVVYCDINNNISSDGQCIFLSGSPTITNCTFTNNIFGILFELNNPPGGSSAALQAETGENVRKVTNGTIGAIISGNNIYGNGGAYELANHMTYDVDASNTWWGTTDINTINARIYDNADDPTKGVVLLGPIAQEEHVFTPTLISLSSFTATRYPRKVVVNWRTESEIDNVGFNIWRAEAENGEYAKITKEMVMAEGSPTQGASYKVIDYGVQPKKVYYYKLEDIDLSGKSTMHGPVSVEVKRFGVRD